MPEPATGAARAPGSRQGGPACESEVLSWLGRGKKVEDILLGVRSPMVSRPRPGQGRVQLEPEYTLVGGILRFPSMGRLLADTLGAVNLPPEDVVQFVSALGAAVLGRQRQRVAA